jgi:hypothetical protein
LVYLYILLLTVETGLFNRVKSSEKPLIVTYSETGAMKLQ